MQNEAIVNAIAAYLEKNTEHIWHSQGERMAFSEPCEYPVFSEQSFLQARAAEIATAIAALVEPKDFPYTELFDHMANEHGLTLTNTELGDIIHVARDQCAAPGLKLKYAIGQKVWIFNGVRYQEENIKYIHIQQGVNPSDMFVRYELAFVSGWFRESEVYETKEAAMADNR